MQEDIKYTQFKLESSMSNLVFCSPYFWSIIYIDYGSWYSATLGVQGDTAKDILNMNAISNIKFVDDPQGLAWYIFLATIWITDLWHYNFMSTVADNYKKAVIYMVHTLLDFDLHIYEHISTHRMCHITLGFQYIWKPWNHIWIYWLYNLVLHVTPEIFNHIFLVLYGRKYNTNIYKSIYTLLIVQFFSGPFFLR